MRKFFYELVVNYNSILTDEKKRGFSIFNMKIFLRLIGFSTIYATSYYIIQLILSISNIAYTYFAFMFGIVLIGIYTLRRIYSMKISLYILSRFVFILSGTFTVLFLVYYQTKVGILVVLFNTLLFLFLIFIELFKYTNGKRNEIGINFLFIILGMLATVIFNIVNTDSLYLEFQVYLLILLGLYSVYFVSKCIKLNIGISITYSIILFIAFVVFGYLNPVSMINNKGNLVVSKYGCEDYSIRQVVTMNGYTYTHYFTPEGKDLIQVTQDSCKVISNHFYENENNTWRFLYVLDNNIYLYQSHFEQVDPNEGHSKLYEIIGSNINLIYDLDVHYHEGVPFIIDGNYTYFVNSLEAYQVVDGKSIPLDEIYDLSNYYEFINNENYLVFYDNERYYFYSSIMYDNWYLYYVTDARLYLDRKGFILWEDIETGYVLTGFSEDYLFYRHESNYYVYDNDSEVNNFYKYSPWLITGIQDYIKFENYDIVAFYEGQQSPVNYIGVIDESGSVIDSERFTAHEVDTTLRNPYYGGIYIGHDDVIYLRLRHYNSDKTMFYTITVNENDDIHGASFLPSSRNPYIAISLITGLYLLLGSTKYPKKIITKSNPDYDDWKKFKL